MKYIISKRQFNLLTEQPDSRFGPERFMTGQEKFKTTHSSKAWDQAIEKEREFNKSLDPHTVNAVFGIASLFIPVVGPFIAAGIGLADAAVYLREGKKNEAALASVFSLLPGISKVVQKIPMIGKLGKKGMDLLSSKIIKRAALTGSELAVVQAVVANQGLVNAELNAISKTLAKQSIQKVADNTTKETLKKVAEHGAEHVAVHSVGSKKKA